MRRTPAAAGDRTVRELEPRDLRNCAAVAPVGNLTIQPTPGSESQCLGTAR